MLGSMSILSWGGFGLGRMIWIFLGLGTVGVVAVVVSDLMIRSAANGKCFDGCAQVPAMDVGLVLGCSPKVAGGRTNLFFTRRIDAAVALYQAGKVRALIVSGDNHREGYDEPTAMKEALVAAGVPESRIYCDYAGFRTLDSVVRAREVFGQDRLVIVSQRFHNERAVYLAQQKGMEEVAALNAADVPVRSAAKTWLRERFARVKAVLDVKILRTEPKFLGEPVKVAL